VAGSSSKKSGGALTPPAMYPSLNELGSIILEFIGTRLDASFLDDPGTFRDDFTILKDTATAGPVVARPGSLAATPTPARSDVSVRFTLAAASHVRVTVHDVHGRTLRTLVAERRTGGSYEVPWDRRGADGEPAGPGVYFVRVEADGFRDTEKIVVLR
jgi:hypothetical protein